MSLYIVRFGDLICFVTYIFWYKRRVSLTNQHIQLLKFVTTYNIHKIWLRGCEIFPISSKLMISHLVYSIFGVICLILLLILFQNKVFLKLFFIENSVFPVRGNISPCTPSLRPSLGASHLYRSLKYVKKRSIDSKKCLKRPKITPNRQRKIERGAGSTCLSFLQGVLPPYPPPPHRRRLCKPTL